MKILKLFLLLLVLASGITLSAQKEMKPDLSQVTSSDQWKADGLTVNLNDDVVHLKTKGDEVGILWMDQTPFANGRIEFDLKGKDVRGENFAGLAFHMEDLQNYDCIYFRAFNFHSEEKGDKAVQYVSMPDYGWRTLRQNHPGVYENEVQPKPDPNDWFHVAIEINYPKVEVFLNNSTEPTLTVNQLSKRKSGQLGFWVSYRTEAWFKNLVVMPESGK